jgi:hypothetical protein
MSSGALPGEVKSRVKTVDSNCIWSLGKTPKMVQWQARNTVTTTWANWLAAGLDAHSVLADPLFTDTAKVFPNNYRPRGDYSVRSGSPALALGFKNFPMDSFGVMNRLPCTGPGCLQNTVGKIKELENAGFSVRFNSGRLVISHDGKYRVTITTALGRTVKVFNGKGDSNFSVDAKIMGAGIYFAVVRAKNGVETKRFIIN